jgi:hypothetical protein
MKGSHYWYLWVRFQINRWFEVAVSPCYAKIDLMSGNIIDDSC